MGKASRAKRERREAAAAAPAPAAGKGAASGPRRQLPVFWIVVGLIVLGGVAALAFSSQGEDLSDDPRVKDAPTYAEVEVEGDALPEGPDDLDDGGDDPAVGEALPTLTGTGLTGDSLVLEATAGNPTLVVVVAHWCPHCQAEVPRIVEEFGGTGPLPGNAQLMTVSTSASEDQPNFPPAEWLVEEGWDYPVLVDDEAGSAAEALGVSGFPFLVFVDGEGNVVSRASGEVSMEDIRERLEEAAESGGGPADVNGAGQGG